jgi:DNA-directed RNA polymerase subunit RPC12/RpoP
MFPRSQYADLVAKGGAGFYRGKHYTEYVDEVTELHSAGHDDEALALLDGLMTAVEEESRAKHWAAPPAYYDQAATIYRKRKNYASEIAVCQRYAKNNHASNGATFDDRIRKARALLAAQFAATAAAGAPNACPHCGKVLDAAPKTSRACPDCGHKIVVRKSGGLVQLLTPEQDVARTQAAAIAKSNEKISQRANQLGFSDAQMTAERKRLTARFGAQASLGDTFWSLANTRALSAETAGKWNQAAAALRSMAAHAASESGTVRLDLVSRAVGLEMRGITLSNPPGTVMQTGGCKCDPCRTHTQDRFTLAEAQAAAPVPHTDCATPSCACYVYPAPPVRQANGSWQAERAPSATTERHGFLKSVFGRSNHR